MSNTIPLVNVKWDDKSINASLEELSPNNIDEKSMVDQKRERYKQDTRQRKFLAYWVVWATSLWLFLTLCIVACQGFQLLKLHTTTINTLLVTTTANVLGLAYIVLRGLFGEKTERYKNS